MYDCQTRNVRCRFGFILKGELTRERRIISGRLSEAGQSIITEKPSDEKVVYRTLPLTPRQAAQDLSSTFEMQMKLIFLLVKNLICLALNGLDVTFAFELTLYMQSIMVVASSVAVLIAWTPPE